MYTGLSIAFLCIEAFLIGMLVYFIFFKKAIIDKKSLIYILPVFILIYCMYITAMVYNKVQLDFYTFFYLIPTALEFLAMSIEWEYLQPLCNSNAVFNAALIVACLISVITLVFSVFVLFGTRIANVLRKRKIFSVGGDIVLGASPSAIEYLKAHKNTVLWVEKWDKNICLDLIKQGYAVHKATLCPKNIEKCLKKKEHHLIIFRDMQYSYFSILSCFETLKKNQNNRLFLHLEANANEMSIVRGKYLSWISDEANSFVFPFCRYELMARRFIIDHPITKYIPRSFFNTNLTLKEEKEINVVFLGFGKVNYELFKLMSTGFQFAKQKEGKLCPSLVHYYVFENNKERFHNEHFIKLLNRYDKIFQGSDLPPAEKVCDLKDVMPMDAHSANVRKQICDLVNENTYTYFIISLSDEFEDAAFAHQIKEDLGESGNYKIFVRFKSSEGCLLNHDKEQIVYFGEDAGCFSRENIVNDDLMQLSQNVNDLYNDYTKDQWAQMREWQKLPIIEQYSNINAATHIYFKVHLMGFALQKGVEMGVTKEEFINSCPTAFMGDKGSNYDYFFKTEAANTLAFIEHSRWNAYYLLAGYKPLPFKDFTWERNKKGKDVLNHKNEEKLRHACLTTYYDLDTLIRHKCKILKEAQEKGEKQVGSIELNVLTDLYRYDYMVIDGMYDALDKLGYSLVKKDA